MFHRLSPNERFQSTLPVWGATERFSVLFHLFVISIHAPRVGSDSSTPCNPVITMLFQSTLPVWGATVWGSFFFGGENISIHAPRVGSDWLPGDTSPPQGDFNPRSPCGERQRERLSFRFVYGFQSTLPVWGATCLDAKCAGVGVHFNPRSPCGERPTCGKTREKRQTFQSTLPVWGATIKPATVTKSTVFQSTLPVWGATSSPHGGGPGKTISIHAPRVGSDFFAFFSYGLISISIHAPRVGSDPVAVRFCYTGRNFNPRSPCGERRA